MHIITTIIVFLVAANTLSSAVKTFEWKSEFWNYISFYRNISDLNNVSPIQCANHCVNNKECVSFFHHNTSGACQLHSFDFPGQVQHPTFVWSPGTAYYRNVNSCRWKDHFYVKELDTFFKPIVGNIVPTWDEASSICEKQNGRLLVMRSEEQLRGIGEILRRLPGSGGVVGYWVGARVNTTVDEFIWTDGRTLPRNSALWKPGSIQYDPIATPWAQCVAMASFSDYKLDDVLCNVTLDMYPLCECLGMYNI